MKSARIFPLVLALTAAPLPAIADDAPTTESPDPTSPRPLPPLPTPPSIALPEAEPSAVQELDAFLDKLTGDDPEARKQAVAEIESPSRRLVPAIAAKVAQIRKTGRLNGMAVVLTQARKSNATTSTDAFDRVMASPRPKDPAWRDLASLLGCSRLLVQIGTTPAVRELVALYPTFDELLRFDVQQQLAKLGDRAVAPLIEARRGETRPLRLWAARQLDALGRGSPGEAVQADDPQVLPEILRAYGRIRDSDAARVVVSFANSDRTLVREAAREAVVLLAENGLWPLREAYEALLGARASETWGWERTAQELFAAYDRARLADVYAQLDEGLAARDAGNLEAMAHAYDAVLARAPKLDRRDETVEGYLEYANALLKADRERALAYLRRALRIDESGPLAPRISAQIAFIEAQDLESRGIVDQAAYQRALDLDANHEGARQALSRIQDDARGRTATLRRYAGYAVAAVSALLGALAFTIRRRSA